MQVSAITPEIFWVGQKVHSGFLYDLTEKPKQTFWATQYFVFLENLGSPKLCWRLGVKLGNSTLPSIGYPLPSLRQKQAPSGQ